MHGFGANRMKHHGSILVMAKSFNLMNDPYLIEEVGELKHQKRTNGLVEMVVHSYGFEISPISATEISLRCVMLIDPQLDSIPESLINWGTKQFAEFMINKMLKFSKNFKGTKYEERLKNTENADFYHWIKKYIVEYCEEKGWPIDLPEF